MANSIAKHHRSTSLEAELRNEIQVLEERVAWHFYKAEEHVSEERVTILLNIAGLHLRRADELQIKADALKQRLDPFELGDIPF
jgi:hypothetical protein